MNTAAPVMGQQGGYRGEDDGCQRGANGKVHQGIEVKPLTGKQHHQRRHDHQSATNAQQTRQETGNYTGEKIRD